MTATSMMATLGAQAMQSPAASLGHADSTSARTALLAQPMVPSQAIVKPLLRVQMLVALPAIVIFGLAPILLKRRQPSHVEHRSSFLDSRAKVGLLRWVQAIFLGMLLTLGGVVYFISATQVRYNQYRYIQLPLTGTPQAIRLTPAAQKVR